MSNNTVHPSMETLPVELLHRIFDNLDTETILVSIRLLSRLFRSVVNTYDRYILNTKLISKFNLHLICRLIEPQNVISLILSNDERTLNQINLFVSLVRLRQFTRLRTLTLLNIDEDQLNLILTQINVDLLTSFSFCIREYDVRHIKTTSNLLASTLAQPTLRQLEFDITSERMSKISWPINCPIQYLTINNIINMDHLLKILRFFPHLHTISITSLMNMFDNNSIPTSFPSIYFRRLTSLTIEMFGVTIDQIESFLLLTPSLVYLKLIGGERMLDGKRWEQFIEINLRQLGKFEFFFDEEYGNKNILADLELTIDSFRTPFWTEHKKWFVTCEFKNDYSGNIQVYTIPICKPSLEYQPPFRKFSLSTSAMMTKNEATIINNVKSLTLTLNKAIAGDIDEKKAAVNRPLFSQVTDVNLLFSEYWPLFSLQSLSIFINITQIVQIKLNSYYFDGYKKDTLRDFGMFLEQAHNLSSLVIRNSKYIHKVLRTFENMYPIIPCQLKRLQIPINTVDQIKRILEKCKKLSIIKLDTTLDLSKLIQWFNDNTINSTCKIYDTTLTVWLGKKKIQATDI